MGRKSTSAEAVQGQAPDLETWDGPVRAFNPMLPAEAEISATPAATLIYRLTDRTRGRVCGSVAMSIGQHRGPGDRAGGACASLARGLTPRAGDVLRCRLADEARTGKR